MSVVFSGSNLLLLLRDFDTKVGVGDFQNKENKCNIYKEIKLFETIGLKLNLKSEMDTFF